jgi:succinate dehydrogenase / fumarate reductase cytochrome b subunit
MSKSAILKSSIARKWWMALTGLFLCLFLVGHLLGNLQLIFIDGVEGKRAFNEYAYFMTHNPLIKIMSYLTYFSILFHAVFGIYLTIKNKKARPINYAYNKPGTNSSTPSRYMAVLGTAILVFIVLHMSAFWGKMHFGEVPLHTEKIYFPLVSNNVEDPTKPYDAEALAYYTTEGDYMDTANIVVKNGDELYYKSFEKEIQKEVPSYTKAGDNPVYAKGYKDLHSMTLAYFGHDKSDEAGIPANKYALIAMILYVLAMIVMAFHLWHGFASAFQSLGLKNKKYTPLISGFGKVFSILVPLAFAIIPIIIFLTK